MADIAVFPAKDPAESLNYTWDFTDLLTATEQIITINSVVITPTTTTPLTTPSSGIVTGGKKVSVILAGGEACKQYTISVNVTTDQPAGNVNIFERSCILPVEDR